MPSFHPRHYIHDSGRIMSHIHAHASLRVIALVPSVLQNFFASFVQNFVQSVCFHFLFAVRIRRKHALLHHQFTRVKHFHRTSDEWGFLCSPRSPVCRLRRLSARRFPAVPQSSPAPMHCFARRPRFPSGFNVKSLPWGEAQAVKKPLRVVWRAVALQMQSESGDMCGGFGSLAQQGFLTLFPAREAHRAERETVQILGKGRRRRTFSTR